MSACNRLQWGQRLGLAVIASFLGFAAVQPARADLFIFNDGYVLQGAVRRESESVFESGEMIIIPKGFYFVDDGPRQIFFGPRMVRDIEKKARPDFVRAVNKKELVLFDPKPVPGVEEVLDTTAFNDSWTRSITFRPARGAPSRSISASATSTPIMSAWIRPSA